MRNFIIEWINIDIDIDLAIVEACEQYEFEILGFNEPIFITIEIAIRSLSKFHKLWAETFKHERLRTEFHIYVNE